MYRILFKKSTYMITCNLYKKISHKLYLFSEIIYLITTYSI